MKTRVGLKYFVNDCSCKPDSWRRYACIQFSLVASENCLEICFVGLLGYFICFKFTPVLFDSMFFSSVKKNRLISKGI